MPDIVVHNTMGDGVLAKLPEEIRAEIDHNAFHVGVLGPDPYFFYRFFAPHFRNGVDKRGTTMHHRKCGMFLMELGKRCCAVPESENSVRAREAFSYFAGFLCHYALDSTVHPYINTIAAGRAGMHTAVERKLDRIALERRGMDRSDILTFIVPFPYIPEIRRAMNAVYGWDDEYFRTGYRHMKIFLWVVKDMHGVLTKVAGSIPAIPVAITPETVQKIAAGDVDSDYKKKIIKGPPLEIPTHGIPKLFALIIGKKNYGKIAAFPYTNHFCDNIDMPYFDRLEEIAEEYAVKLVTAAYDYRDGRIDEKQLAAIIGNRSYSGGAATE